MKKLKIIILLLLSVMLLSACSFEAVSDKTKVDPQQELVDISKLSVDEQKTTNQSQTTTMQNLDPNNFENLSQEFNGAILKTNQGDIKVKFYNNDSPFTVNNFLNLAKIGFYNGTKFHRVISDFMVQGGDPNSKDDDWSNDGQGGPGYRFADEFNNNKLVAGSLAMANSGVDTNGSQFFIVTAQATPWLDGKHTNFGYVVEGMEVVEKIEALPRNENDHPTVDAIVESIELISE